MLSEFRENFMTKLRRQQREKILNKKRVKKTFENNEGNSILETLKSQTLKMLEYLKNKDKNLLEVILEIHKLTQESVFSLSKELFESHCLQTFMLIFNKSQIIQEPIIVKKILEILLCGFEEENDICEEFFQEHFSFYIEILMFLGENKHYIWYSEFLKFFTCIFHSVPNLIEKFFTNGFVEKFLESDEILENYFEERDIILEYLRLLAATVKPSK